jgi:predicted NodU family carbamoyl transferase
MKKILGINISHNCSFAFLKDGTLKEYYEEERFNYIKDYMPEENNHGIYDYKYKALDCFKDITFDMVIFASYNRGHLQIEMPIVNHILTQVNHKDFSFYLDNHHIYHAICGLYFSKFNF